MASIREGIIAEAVTRLTATTGISSRCYRSRTEAGARGEMPMLVVTPRSDLAERNDVIESIDRTLLLNVGVIVHGDTPDQVADPIIVDLHKRLCPAGDVTLGGRAIDVSLAGDDFEFAHTDGVIIVSYQIRYRHSDSDLSLP
jgi:hypothetical protein